MLRILWSQFHFCQRKFSERKKIYNSLVRKNLIFSAEMFTATRMAKKLPVEHVLTGLQKLL